MEVLCTSFYLALKLFFKCFCNNNNNNNKGKSVQLQGWSGPEGSRKFGSPDYVTAAQDGGKVVGLTHRPPLPPGNTPGTHFC